MALLRKFDFGQSFDKPLDAALVAADIAAQPEPPPEPTYTQADLDAAESRGFVAGRTEGTRVALERQEYQIALAAADIARMLPALATKMDAARTEIERQAASALLLVAERLFPQLIGETGERETAALLEQAFQRAFEEPWLTIRCPKTMRGPIEKLVKDAAAGAGYDGKLTIIGDPAFAEGGCRVEWSDGGLERDPEALLARIESALRQGLEVTSPNAASAIAAEMTPKAEMPTERETPTEIVDE